MPRIAFCSMGGNRAVQDASIWIYRSSLTDDIQTSIPLKLMTQCQNVIVVNIPQKDDRYLVTDYPGEIADKPQRRIWSGGRSCPGLIAAIHGVYDYFLVL